MKSLGTTKPQTPPPPKKKSKSKTSLKPINKNDNLSFAIFAIHSLTRSLQSTWFRVPSEGINKSTDIAICRLNLFSENVQPLVSPRGVGLLD